ncbi:6TM ABC transporter family protein [Mycoplasmopsis lipofaciens]|uniref:hypothetical protein n=1 Tax=Mycoplasmopsis lipofaciens TaxID=114884 RepID=UPI0004879002|nr:hypothetical protein [Mycoplasmopsis lipofaciens]
MKKTKIRKKINIDSRELKNKSDVVGDVNFNIAIEILKFIILLFISASFILLQYRTTFNSSSFATKLLRKIYLYTFGLAFGDLMILLLIGLYITFFLRWFGLIYKNYYFKWFKKYIWVDYWILRKYVTIFIWLLLLAFAILYHLVLLSHRVSNFFFYKVSDIKNIYTKGWFYVFTNQGISNLNIDKNIPQAFLNVGIFFDSLFNLVYVLTFSPYVSILLFIVIFIYSWLILITLSPKKYFRNLNSKTLTLIQIEKYLQQTSSMFYYTNNCKKCFDFYKSSAEVLKIDYFKVKFVYLLKQIDKNMQMLSSYMTTKNYFVDKKNINIFENKTDIEFLKEIDNQEQKIVLKPDVTMPSIVPDNLLISREIDITDFNKTKEHILNNTFGNTSEYLMNSYKKENIEEKTISNDKTSTDLENVKTLETIENSTQEKQEKEINLEQTKSIGFVVNTEEIEILDDYKQDSEAKNFGFIIPESFTQETFLEVDEKPKFNFEFGFDTKIITQENNLEEHSILDNDSEWISPILKDNE